MWSISISTQDDRKRFCKTIWRFIIKYKQDYAVEDLLKGEWNPSIIQKIKNAPLDEHLSIAGLLSGRLGEALQPVIGQMQWSRKFMNTCFYIGSIRKSGLGNGDRTDYAGSGSRKKAEQLTRTEEKTMQKAEAFFETARIRVNESSGSKEAVYEEVKAQFEAEAERLEEQTEEGSRYAAACVCVSGSCIWREPGDGGIYYRIKCELLQCVVYQRKRIDAYYRYNKGLLFEERQQKILGQMEEVETLLNAGIKS